MVHYCTRTRRMLTNSSFLDFVEFSPTHTITFCACVCNSTPGKQWKSWVPRLDSDLSYPQTHDAGRHTKSRVHSAGTTDVEAAYNLRFREVRLNPPNPPGYGPVPLSSFRSLPPEFNIEYRFSGGACHQIHLEGIQRFSVEFCWRSGTTIKVD